MKAVESVDSILVHKSPSSYWTEITLFIHEKEEARITIRSKEMAEQLHFMLGQMLSTEE